MERNKARGLGFIYQPTPKDKRTGELKTASTWWIQYSVRGDLGNRPVRQSECGEQAAEGSPGGRRARKTRRTQCGSHNVSKISRAFWSRTARRTVAAVRSAFELASVIFEVFSEITSRSILRASE